MFAKIYVYTNPPCYPSPVRMTHQCLSKKKILVAPHDAVRSYSVWIITGRMIKPNGFEKKPTEREIDSCEVRLQKQTRDQTRGGQIICLKNKEKLFNRKKSIHIFCVELVTYFLRYFRRFRSY